MKLPFILLAESDGSFMTGQAANVTIRLSKDAGEFSTADKAVVEFAPGYYQISLNDNDLDINEFLIVEITCPGAQKQVKQVVPDVDIVDLINLTKDVTSGVLYWRIENDILTTYNSDSSIRRRYNVTRDNNGVIIRIQPINA